MQVPLT